jgi:hypothetical protein
MSPVNPNAAWRGTYSEDETMREYEEYERGEEFKAMGQAAKACLDAILADHGADTLSELARNLYKYSDCGAALGALVYAGEDNPGRWVYGDELRNLKPDDFVCALSVSSIVEGVEQCTETHIVDLFDDKFETPEQANAAYGTAVEAVEAEADEIWKQTHGCPTCAKHYGNCGEFGPIEGNDGMTPIWDECPDCKGHGTVI